jgi:hypothetical protein
MSAADETAHHCPAVRKRDGQPCTGKPTASGWCVAHDPHANEWRSKGGHKRSNAARALKLLPARLRPVVEALETAFTAACAGELVGDGANDKDNAMLIAPLARALLAAVQAGILEERVLELERLAQESQQEQGNTGRRRMSWATRTDD